MVADSAKEVVESMGAGDDADRAVVEEVSSDVCTGDTGVVWSATDMNSKAGGCSCLAREG